MVDIEGNQRAVFDARQRLVMRYDYDMLGNRIHQASMEAGERWMLVARSVSSKPSQSVSAIILPEADMFAERAGCRHTTMRRPLCFLCRKGGYVSPALKRLTQRLRTAILDDQAGRQPL